MKNNNILVTGGCGFIGVNLCSELLKNKQNIVYCLDNLSSGIQSNCNYLSSIGGSRFNFILGDVIDANTFLNLIPLNISQIYHLACPASPPFYQKDGVSTLRTCFEGTLNVLSFAERGGARVLFTSTSEIYGEPLEHPQNESYRGNVNTMGPRACYDEGKRVAETLCYEFRMNKGVDVRIVRLFNTYGHGMRMDDGRVVTNFLSAILRGEDINLHGGGNQTRSFCYISDTIDAILQVMNLDKSNGFGPYNIGNPNEITIKELADMIDHVIGGISIIRKESDAREDDPSRRKPDITRICSVTGWEPKISLEEGIKLFLEPFLISK